MTPLLLLLAGLNLATTAASLAAEAPAPTKGWTFEDRDPRLAFRLDGQPVAEFVYRDATILRPFFANLRAPGGVPVTRHHPPQPGADATDHDTMHPGVWLAFGDINGQDFWRNKGRIEHVRFLQPPSAAGGRLAFATECRLLAADRSALGSLSNRFTLVALTHAWLLVWEADFHAGSAGLNFGDQEEMGFGARVATALTEKNGGLITSSTGLKTAKMTWGQPADWCDYSGSVNGRRAGLTLMADPANLRPSWWHNRDYGLIVANPFGRKSMNQGEPSRVVVQPGERLRLRFGVLSYSAATAQDLDGAAAYRDFVRE